MVTTNSGSAMPIIASNENTGATRTGAGQAAASTLAGTSVDSPTMTAVTATASGTAYSRANRSEEHTSELQSLMRISYAVVCLKKKNSRIYIHTSYPISQ